MRLRFFGGLEAEADDAPVEIRGRGQEALLFRLALDAGTTVAYRSLAEDVWPDDLPEDPRASLQSLASRLRRVVPAGTLEAVPGGYRLAMAREDVDIALFQDLVDRARHADDPAAAVADARAALALWRGEPWTPGEGFDWVVRDLLEDRAHAERIAGAGVGISTGASASPGAAAATASIAPAPEPPAGVSPAAAVATSVPASLTPLIGRTRELELIESQLRSERLVTLIGPGGAGKTTLAFETARRTPGSIVVELAPAAPGEVWAAVAGAVGRSIRVGELVSTSARDRVVEALAGRSVLVVLDNCEHVSAEAAGVALDLLGSAPGSRILATSREPLGLAGEAFVDLGPLPGDDARELFTRRVRAARGTPPAGDEAAAVERIVSRLDGLPLALELAAAKSRTLTIAEIDSGLDDRFALLATGPRALEARHQTLRALIDWSWETLTDAERTALLAAAVFPDGIDARDVPAVAAAFDVDGESFEGLVDKSLLRRSEGRLRMLETVREYGVDRLRTEGREAAFRAREARAMSELAARQDALLRGPRVREGLAWFDADEENLTAALRTCAEQPGLEDIGIRLVRACFWTWIMRERFTELQSGIGRFGEAAAALDSEPAVVVRAIALLGLAFAPEAGKPDPAAVPMAATDDGGARDAATGGIPPAEDSAARPGVPTPSGLARLEREAPAVVAAAAVHRSELSAAVPPLLHGLLEEARQHVPGAPWTRSFTIRDDGLEDAPAWTHAFLSMMRSALAQNTGDTRTLGAESDRALSMFLELGDVWGTAFASQMRSEWLQLAGRLEEALAVADASTEGLAGLTSTTDLVQQRSQSIGLLLRLGRIDEARERLAGSRELARSFESPRALAQTDMDAAMIEIAVGDGAEALRHLDAIDAQMLPAFPDQLTAWSQSRRAQALLLEGRADEALDALRQAYPSAAHSGDHPIVSDVAVSIAGWLALAGRDADARRALVAAARLRGGVDATDPFLRVMRARFETDVLVPGATDGAGHDSDSADELAVLAALLS
ncbi:ATPase [Microbacterium sp. QXD-8]|uniref:ATPase n=1 Tax=Microbacterium psychrotolerans TaxID=3068321 RepID=A0ABU0Z437_9MICO|nr:ATPase [Microbacterium sp. QXD-8]MDQ7879351.1 ATPase [Microbacterium sp. QXD-8]